MCTQITLHRQVNIYKQNEKQRVSKNGFILTYAAETRRMQILETTETNTKNFSCYSSGFGGLGVSVLATGTRVRGFKPGQAVGFLGRINPQHAFLRRGSKDVGPMSYFAACKISQNGVEVVIPVKFTGQYFSHIVPSFATRIVPGGEV